MLRAERVISSMSTLKNSICYTLLFLLPKNFVSCMLGKLVSLPLPRGLALFVNKWFARVFKIDLDEAALPIENFPNLQQFFIRRLKPGTRPIADGEHLMVSPCDGHMSVHGTIVEDQLLQIKGKYYGLLNLLRDTDCTARFRAGHYATIYLSPRDYHRFHCPIDGVIVRSFYIPGTLWPVNRWAVSSVEQLFCQNERVVTLIEEPHTKKLMAHIAVGATVVGRMALAYTDFDQYLKTGAAIQEIDHVPIMVSRGQELGRFMFGSTIVLLMEPGLMTSFTKMAPTHVKMGETLGNLHLGCSSSSLS